MLLPKFEGSKDNDVKSRFGNMDMKMPNFTTSFVLFGTGAGLSVGGLMNTLKVRRSLYDAVDYYNR